MLRAADLFSRPIQQFSGARRQQAQRKLCDVVSNLEFAQLSNWIASEAIMGPLRVLLYCLCTFLLGAAGAQFVMALFTGRYTNDDLETVAMTSVIAGEYLCDCSILCIRKLSSQGGSQLSVKASFADTLMTDLQVLCLRGH